MRRCQFGVAGVAGLAMTLAAAMATAADSDTREVAGTRHDKSAAATAAAPASAMQELIETLHDNGTTADAAYQRLKAVAAADAEDKRQQPAPAAAKFPRSHLPAASVPRTGCSSSVRPTAASSSRSGGVSRSTRPSTLRTSRKWVVARSGVVHAC